MRVRSAAVSALLALASVQAGVVGQSTLGHATAPHQIALVAQNEELDAYDIQTGTLKTFVPKEFWVNGTPCFIPGDAADRFVEADDSPTETFTDAGGHATNGEKNPFFGVFNGHTDSDAPAGHRLMTAKYGNQGRIGADVPMQDPAGCAFDAAGNLFGVDVGNVHAPLIGDGQLVEFFAATKYTTWCVIDPALSQPGMPVFDATGGLLVPEAGFGQILRFSGFPADASRCSRAATKDVWMTAAQGIGTPIGIASDSHGGFAVSSVLVPPAIFHVSLLAGHPVVDGLVAAPGPDTGTPFGLAYDAAGSVFFADLGVRPFPLTCLPGQGESDPNGEGGCDPTSPIGSAANTGGFSMVKAGVPVPVRLASNWNYPDGVAVVNASQIDS